MSSKPVILQPLLSSNKASASPDESTTNDKTYFVNKNSTPNSTQRFKLPDSVLMMINGINDSKTTFITDPGKMKPGTKCVVFSPVSCQAREYIYNPASIKTNGSSAQTLTKSDIHELLKTGYIITTTKESEQIGHMHG